MRRLRLTGTVRITGPDFWGRQSTLVIEPIDDPADYRWLWRWKYKKYVPITPALFGVGGFLGRCVVLTHQVDGTTSAEEMNEETGRHRFLDALGVLAFVPPPGHYLCGIYHSVLGGHMTDIGLAKELYRKARSAALPLCRVA